MKHTKKFEEFINEGLTIAQVAKMIKQKNPDMDDIAQFVKAHEKDLNDDKIADIIGFYHLDAEEWDAAWAKVSESEIFEGTNDLIKYEIECRDGYGSLKKIIECIMHCGNMGHTFNVIVDPDEKEGLSERKFEWDGDGSDYIKSIKAIDKTTESIVNEDANNNAMILDLIDQIQNTITTLKKDKNLVKPEVDKLFTLSTPFVKALHNLVN
jgi:hypothetical protein